MIFVHCLTFWCLCVQGSVFSSCYSATDFHINNHDRTVTIEAMKAGFRSAKIKRSAFSLSSVQKNRPAQFLHSGYFHINNHDFSVTIEARNEILAHCQNFISDSFHINIHDRAVTTKHERNTVETRHALSLLSYKQP